jgi:YidC/Oxa1 family membrane protein insertase
MMNRNTILAFLLIIGVVWFFSSPFYYEKILKIPHPSKVAEKQRREKAEKSKEQNQPSLSVDKQQVDIKEDTSSGLVSAQPETDTGDSRVPDDTIIVETKKLIVSICERGGRIISVKTKDYSVNPVKKHLPEDHNIYMELVGDTRAGGGNLSLNSESYDNKHFECLEDSSVISVMDDDNKAVAFYCQAPDGTELRKVFRFEPDGYVVGLRIESPSMDGKNVMVGWNGGIAESEQESSSRQSSYLVRNMHLFDGKNVSHLMSKKAEKIQESGYYKWIGLTSKYFLVAMIADSVRDADITIESFEEDSPGDNAGKKKARVFNYRFRSQRFAGGNTESYSLYVGPSQYGSLKGQSVKLEKVLFSGWKWFFWADVWFPALCEFVLWLLIALQKVVGDYGVVIIILTILSKVITYPLTYSSMKSMSRMRDIQPKVNEIREKYKADARKMNQKMMELYKKEGVNPLNPGCLPMFLQMPVFISLFIVLQRAIELRGMGTWLIPWVHDLSKPEVLPIPFVNPLPFEIPMYGRNVALLPIVMAVLTYFQNKATIKDPNQKMMIYFMPVFMLVLFNNFPSGLVLYWTFSSALSLVQQYWTDIKKRREGLIRADVKTPRRN